MTQKANIYQRKECDLIKNKHNKSKWLTNGILISIKEKDKLYKKLVLANIEDEIANFLNIINIIQFYQ